MSTADETPAVDSIEDIITATAVTASPTTFDSPIVGNDDVPQLNRKVTIYASGSVSVDDALQSSNITLKQEDIRAALGVGDNQWVPPLSGARISHYFNPTSQRLGLRVMGQGNTALVEDSAMARNPHSQKVEKSCLLHFS
jgi:hypothetical protein